jgi:hypothetical protein
MCLACQTLPRASLILLAVVFSACDRQSGYWHGAHDLTAEDLRQIHVVQQSPLGKPALMREIVDASGEPTESLGDCEFSVSKVVEYDRPKDRFGRYPWHYVVKCVAELGNDGEDVEYSWEVDNSERGVTSLRWGSAQDHEE